MSIDDAVNGVISGAEKKIGSINSVDVRIDRDTNIWREFNSDRAGLPKEVYPTLPTYELTLTKIMLYKNMHDASGATHDNLMTTFGFNEWQSGFDVVAQHKPLMIKIQLLSPRDPAGNVVAGYPAYGNLIFYDVWLDSSPMKFELSGTDLVIEQSVGAKAAGIIFA
jgi:NAD(P)H-dependent flavin oxidoreductase YrpB (nitropropane dioxygenase family)